MSALEVWGLDDVAETTYRAMLRNPDFDAERLGRHLELAPAELDAAVESLVRAGLVGHGPAGFVPASPATTLAALVHGELSEIEERRARLDAVRASLAGFAADHAVGQSRAWASVPFELLSLEESFAAVEDLQRGTTGEVLSCHQAVDIDVDSPAYVELIENQLAAGRPMRGLYPVEVLGHPDRLAYVRHWADAGERVRLSDRALPSVATFGAEVALVSADDEAGAPVRMLLRAPALVELVRALFEEYWSQAVPLPGRAVDGAARAQDDADDATAVLELLKLGMKDESIARQLGVSLRTVRRRIADVLDDLGASTRFQAGAEAARRGLL
jgi:DNA-binding CsgD family transcriptional regulator